MAEGRDPIDKFYERKAPGSFRSVNVADWSDGQDSESHQKRSDIVCSVITHKHTDHLKKILASGWDVNEILTMNMTFIGTCQPMTALQAAIWWRWTEGVKLLLDAGADYMTPGVLESSLKLALQNFGCHADLIDLLLKHGADPNPSVKVFSSFPLGQAIACLIYNDDDMNIVKLLLENGADANVTVLSETQELYKYKCPLTECVDLLADMIDARNVDSIWFSKNMVKQVLRLTAALFKMLVNFGANVNWNVHETKPLLHRLVVCEVARRISVQFNLIRKLNNPTRLFPLEHLDVFYQNGGNINMKYGSEGTALDYTIRKLGHSNSVRWLIRHGADVHPTMFILLNRHFIPEHKTRSNLHQLVEETPLILLQAGMRVSHGAYDHLINIEKELSTWQEWSYALGGRDNLLAFQRRLKDLGTKLVKEGNEDLEKLKNKSEKCIFPEHWSKQMVDLDEFSADSLHVYPESIPKIVDHKDELTFVSDQIHKVLEFLSQTQSLQWYCRRCVHENLVSLQPSVVKTLPVPARLKRFILCHEI